MLINYISLSLTRIKSAKKKRKTRQKYQKAMHTDDGPKKDEIRTDGWSEGRKVKVKVRLTDFF